MKKLINSLLLAVALIIPLSLHAEPSLAEQNAVYLANCSGTFFIGSGLEVAATHGTGLPREQFDKLVKETELYDSAEFYLMLAKGVGAKAGIPEERIEYTRDRWMKGMVELMRSSKELDKSYEDLGGLLGPPPNAYQETMDLLATHAHECKANVMRIKQKMEAQ